MPAPRRRKPKVLPPLPYEDEEQAAVIEYCEIMHMPYFHVNNEMWTESWSQLAKAKKLGVKKGVPDLFIFIPVGRHFDGDIAYQQVTVEMKRKKGNNASAEQKAWGKILEQAGIPHTVAKGAMEAIGFLKFAKSHYTKRWKQEQDRLQSFKEALSAAMQPEGKANESNTTKQKPAPRSSKNGSGTQSLDTKEAGNSRTTKPKAPSAAGPGPAKRRSAK